MAKLEQIREALEGNLNPEYLKQRQQAGWRMVAINGKDKSKTMPESPARPSRNLPSAHASRATASISRRTLKRCSFSVDDGVTSRIYRSPR